MGEAMKYRVSPKKLYMFLKVYFWQNVIELSQNLVNILNSKSIYAKLKKLCWDQLRKVDNYTYEKWKFFAQELNNHKVFNKYICLLVSIQKPFWLSRLLLCQWLPNRGESVSLLCRFGGDPLHTHPKRHEFLFSTH